MSLNVRSYDDLVAEPDGFTPLLDYEGNSTNEDYIRLWTPKEFYRALDGIEGGYEEDPLYPGHLGSRWYRLGRLVHGGISPSSSAHSTYRRALRALTWGAPLAAGPFAQHEPFWDLINFPDNQGVIGHIAAVRLAEAYEKYPDITQLLTQRNITHIDEDGTDRTDLVIQLHDSWRDLVTTAASFDRGVLILS